MIEWIAGIILSLLLLCTSCAKPQEPAPDTDPALGVNAFGMMFFGQVAKREGNFCFSPFSIRNAFAMAFAGACGDTARQMGAVFHFPQPAMEAHRQNRSFNDRLVKEVSETRSVLKQANAFWAASDRKFREEFLQRIKTYYGSELKKTDFSDVQASVDKINQWITEKTNGKILGLLTPDMISPQYTAFILANALYLKARWAERFFETSMWDFTLLTGSRIQVPTMLHTGYYEYGKASGVEILEKDLEGADLSMVILLPKSHDDFSKLQDSLSPEMLRECLDDMERKELEVHLPSFNVETTLDLITPLIAMGMTHAFSKKNADFSGIRKSNRPLWIEPAMHRTWIAVDEEGIEAGCATEISGMESEEDEKPPPVFRVDRPFIFMVRHKTSGCILFLGRITNPLDGQEED